MLWCSYIKKDKSLKVAVFELIEVVLLKFCKKLTSIRLIVVLFMSTYVQLCSVIWFLLRIFRADLQVACRTRFSNRSRRRYLVKVENYFFPICYSKLPRKCGRHVSVVICVRYGVCSSFFTKSLKSNKSFRWISSFEKISYS